MLLVSIIIRVKNEAKSLKKIFKILKKQTFQNFEIIIVDSGSIDDTLKIAEKYPAKIIKIKQKYFTHPYALNLGAKSARGKYLVFLSGHSIPIFETWLSDGLKNFNGEKIAGVYCPPVYPLNDASLVERIICFAGRMVYRKRKIIKTPGMGVMGATNCMIKKDLWEKYNFNLDFANGGEDQDWISYWMRKEYVAIRDIKFTVRHTHGVGLFGYYKQLRFWKSCAKPHKFEYRKHKFS